MVCVEAADYMLVEENLLNFPINVSDQNRIDDVDLTESDISVDNMIGVKLTPGETDDGNDFVDSNKGKITGYVNDDLSNPLVGVLVELKWKRWIYFRLRPARHLHYVRDQPSWLLR